MNVCPKKGIVFDEKIQIDVIKKEYVHRSLVL